MPAVTMVVRGCLRVAPFLFPVAVLAQTESPPRADIIACVKAVDGLEDTMRYKMQSHCFVIAGNYCEAPLSGPNLTCLGDLSEDMRAYVEGSRPLLPATIDNKGLRAASYKRAIERLGADRSEVARCEIEYSKTFDRAICLSAARYGRVLDLFNAARSAGIELP